MPMTRIIIIIIFLRKYLAYRMYKLIPSQEELQKT